MEATNIKEAKELVVRYRSITEDEIDGWTRRGYPHSRVLSILTGFGRMNTCTLCIESYSKYYATDSIPYPCYCCIHNNGTDTDIKQCTNHHTYEDLVFQQNTDAMLRAYKARADYLQTLIEDYEKRD